MKQFRLSAAVFMHHSPRQKSITYGDQVGWWIEWTKMDWHGFDVHQYLVKQAKAKIQEVEVSEVNTLLN